MNSKTSIEQSNRQPDYTAAVVKRMLQIGVLVLVQAAALFISADRLDWVAGWAYMGVYVGFIALNALLMLPHNAELAQSAHKFKRTPGVGTKPFSGSLLFSGFGC